MGVDQTELKACWLCVVSRGQCHRLEETTFVHVYVGRNDVSLNSWLESLDDGRACHRGAQKNQFQVVWFAARAQIGGSTV